MADRARSDDALLEHLSELRSVCLEHGDRGSATIVAELLDLHANDRARFWDALASNTVWGGSGSIADQCLVSSDLPDAERARGRRRVLRALVGIADEMISEGRVNVRTSMWADAFRGRLRDGV